MKFTLKDLKLDDKNRDIIPAHVERLQALIAEHGYFKGCPIIVTNEGYIIDGQHRYLACKNLNIEPDIVIQDNFDIVPILNSSQVKWQIGAYVKYWAAKGFPDFIILQNICKAKEISPSIAYSIVFGKNPDRTGYTKGNKLSPLKDGTFKFPDHSKKYFDKLERKIDAILNLVSALRLPKTDRLIIALTRLSNQKEFSFSTMLKKLEYQMSRVYRCSTIDEYLIMLVNIYNNKNSNKINL